MAHKAHTTHKSKILITGNPEYEIIRSGVKTQFTHQRLQNGIINSTCQIFN